MAALQATATPDLPPAVVERILQHVPLKQRLSSCALASRAWALAAAEATTAIPDATSVHVVSPYRGQPIQQQHVVSPDQLPQLQTWLQQHAGCVTSLNLQGNSMRLFRADPNCWLQLPAVKLSGLQTLHLSGLPLLLPDAAAAVSTAAAPAHNVSASTAAAPAHNSPASTAQASLAVPILPALKSLVLESCVMRDLSCMDSLSWPSGLTNLEMYNIKVSSSGTERSQHQATAALSSGLLQQVTNLQRLHLHLPVTSLDTVQQVTALQNLQELDLWFDGIRGYGGPTALPESLTKLAVGCFDADMGYGEPQPYPKFMGGLGRLQQLRVLEVSGGPPQDISVMFDPSHMAGMSHLQRICLSACQLLPVDVSPSWKDAAGTRGLLGVLKHMTNLEHISLTLERLDVQQEARLFSSLTASTKLTCLEVKTSQLQPLPQHAASHMFGPQQPLPLLQQLTLSVVPEHIDELEPYVPGADEWCIDAADLGSIVRSCPALRQLDLRFTLSPCADMSPVLQLRDCQALIIGGHGFGDQQAEVVGQLTQLTKLQWEFSPGLTDIGLEQLTCLTNLCEFTVDACESISADVAEDGYMFVHSKDDKGPVWQQLVDLLAGSPTVTAARLARAESHLQHGEAGDDQLPAEEEIMVQPRGVGGELS